MRKIVKLIRWLIAAVAIVIVLVVVAAAVLVSEFGVKHVILPVVNAQGEVHVSLDGWRFRPWGSLRAQGVRIGTRDRATGATNTLAELESIDVQFKLRSILAGAPVLTRVVIEKPAIGLQAGPPPLVETVERVEKEEQEPEAGAAAPLPLTVELLEVRDGHVNFRDASGASVVMQGLTLQARNLGPGQRSELTLDASVAYSDGADVNVQNMNLAVREEAAFGAGSVPEELHVKVAVSDVEGVAGTANLAPLDFSAEMFVRNLGGEAMELTSCVAMVAWDGRELARASVTGLVSAVRQSAQLALDLRMAAGPLWQGLAGRSSHLNLRDSSVTAKATLDAAEQFARIKMTGNAIMEQVGLTVPTGPSPAPFDLSAAFSLALDNEAQTLNIPALNVQALQGARPVLSVKTEAPLTVAFGESESMPSGPEKTSLSVVVDALPLSQFNGLLASNDTEITAGTLSANYKCDVIRLGEEIRLQGSARAQGLALRMGDGRWNDLGYAETVDMTVRNLKQFTIGRWLGQFTLGGRPAGEIAVGGQIDLATMSNRVALAVADLRSELFRPLLDPGLENRRLENLVITLQALTESDDPARMPQSVTAQATIANAGTPRPGEWDKLSWRLGAAISRDVVTLSECTLDLQPGQWQDNELHLTGTAYLQRTNAVSRLLLASDHFDATVLLDTLAPEEGKAVQPPTPSIPSPGEPGREPAPLPLEGRNVDFKVNVKDLVAREVRVQPLQGAITLADGVLTIDTAGTRVNGGTVGLNMETDFSVTGYHYSATFTSRDVPLEPIVNTFVPKVKGDVSGLLVGAMEMSGRGLTKPHLTQYLTGTGRLDVVNGHLFNVPIFDQVGKMLNNESLQRLSFSNATAQLDVARGVVNVHELEISGKNMDVGVQGTVTFDEELFLAMHLGLSGQQVVNALTRFYPREALPYGEALSGFYELPIPIRIVGTIGNPRVSTSMTQLVPAMAKAVGLSPAKQLDNLIKEIPVGENVQEGITTLKNILLQQLQQQGGGTR